MFIVCPDNHVHHFQRHHLPLCRCKLSIRRGKLDPPGLLLFSLINDRVGMKVAIRQIYAYLTDELVVHTVKLKEAVLGFQDQEILLPVSIIVI